MYFQKGRKMFAISNLATLPGDLGSRGTGWIAQVPDLRDFTDDHDKVKKMKEGLNLGKLKMKSMEDFVDLRKYCTEIRDQQNLGSCTAHAATGMVEYYLKRAFEEEATCSRLFVYKTTRNLMGVTGDTGAYLRNTMGSLVLCGVPPEKYWPYTDNKIRSSIELKTFDDEPTAFIYSIADNYESLVYFCHDPLDRRKSPEDILNSVKLYLAAGIPAMLGFYGFGSFNDNVNPGEIPFPCPGEKIQWGHAILAVGYDNQKKIKNTRSCNETKGALLIRNSWGKDWGDRGYGWLPYEYIHKGLASDFWSLLYMKWVETGKFGF